MQKNKLNKTAAVYYSAGIGDTLLLTPLVKQLKKDGYKVTGIFTSSFGVHELFEGNDLLDEKIIILSKPKLVWFMTRYSLNKFDRSFVNYFAANKSNLLAASRTSGKVYTNRKVNFKLNTLNNIRLVDTKENIHDGEQNLRLFKKNTEVKEEDFQLLFRPQAIDRFNITSPYVVLQAGAGNNTAPYKVWDINNWKMILDLTLHEFPGLSIVLMGDKNEIDLGTGLQQKGIIDLTGTTNLKEAAAILQHSCALLGTDSGLMHLAVALNLPTFTIWGASNEHLYSYNAFNKEKHEIITHHISCRPCSSWIGANTSRFDDPKKCPDHECISGITPKKVHEFLYTFLKRHLNNAE